MKANLDEQDWPILPTSVIIILIRQKEVIMNESGSDSFRLRLKGYK